MVGRSLKASQEGIDKANSALTTKSWSRQDLAGKVVIENKTAKNTEGISIQTVHKFFTGETVDRKFFVSICKALELDWQEIAESAPKNEFQPEKKNQENLDHKLKAQFEKSRIVEELSIFIPSEKVFFQEQTSPSIQNRLVKLVSKLKEHIKLHEPLLSLTVDDYVKLGDALYCLKNYEEAEEQYKNAIKEHPEAYRALFGIGNALRKQGQKQQAEGQKRQAHELFQKAIDFYERATIINPYYFVAYVNKGLANRRLRTDPEGLKEGIKCFEEAIDISPNYYRAWYDKACYYALLGEHDDAIKSLKTAIEIAPKQCKDLAEKDEDFCLIKNNEEFKKLIPDYNAKCEPNSEE